MNICRLLCTTFISCKLLGAQKRNILETVYRPPIFNLKTHTNHTATNRGAALKHAVYCCRQLHMLRRVIARALSPILPTVFKLLHPNKKKSSIVTRADKFTKPIYKNHSHYVYDYCFDYGLSKQRREKQFREQAPRGRQLASVCATLEKSPPSPFASACFW